MVCWASPPTPQRKAPQQGPAATDVDVEIVSVGRVVRVGEVVAVAVDHRDCSPHSSCCRSEGARLPVDAERFDDVLGNDILSADTS